MSRPDPIQVGPLRCRVVRGPKKGRPEEWYWRIWYLESTVWAGWDTASAVGRRAAQLVADDNFIPRTTGKPRTVGDLLRVWASEYKSRSDIAEGTVEIKRRNLGHLLDHLDPIALVEVGQDDVDRYRDDRLAEGDAPSTIEIEHRTLAQAWNWGRKRSFVSGYLPPLEIEAYDVYNHRTPTDEEVERLMVRLDERAGRRVNGAWWPRLMVLIMNETGARLAEVGTFHWCRVHFDIGKITLLGKRTGRRRTKESQPRTIPVSPRLLSELRLWALKVGDRSPNAPVLGVKHKAIRSRGIWHITEACKDLGIEPFTNHGLRRRAIRRFRKKGVGVKEAAAYFGHSEVVMLRMYDEVEEGDLEAAIEKVYGR